MRIVLLNGCYVQKNRRDFLQNTYAHLRLGIISIASCLKRSGAEVLIVDPVVEKLLLEQVVAKILDFDPEVVGMPAYTDEINDAASIAEAIKLRRPSIKTVIGGPHATALPTETLNEFRAFDLLVIGEGENPMLDLLARKEFSEIRGIVYRDAEGKPVRTPPQGAAYDLDALPMPALELFHPERYPIVSVETVRGCPFPCVFCHRATGKSVRNRSPEKIADDIERAYLEFGVKRFSLVGGGTFPFKKTHGIAVCNEIVKRKLPIQWETAWRCDLVDEEMVQAMRASGCAEVALGVESVDEDLLKLIRKNTTLDQIENSVRLFKKHKINVELNFILGLPKQTHESLKESYKIIYKLAKYSHKVNFAILSPFPGTEVYRLASQNQEGLSIRTNDWREYGKQAGNAIKHDNFKQSELKRYQFNFYMMVYLRHPQKLWHVFNSQRAIGFVMRGLGWY